MPDYFRLLAKIIPPPMVTSKIVIGSGTVGMGMLVLQSWPTHSENHEDAVGESEGLGATKPPSGPEPGRVYSNRSRPYTSENVIPIAKKKTIRPIIHAAAADLFLSRFIGDPFIRVVFRPAIKESNDCAAPLLNI
jgi:hypothetical protein